MEFIFVSTLNHSVQGFDTLNGINGVHPFLFMAIAQATIRRDILSQRRALSASYRLAHQSLILEKLKPICLQYKNIAFYYPFQNEVDMRLLWPFCEEREVSTYLPTIDHNNRLVFSIFNQKTPFTEGKFGIPMPCKTDHTSSESIDCYFVPLVACDKKGFRIGMGRGFYDDYFAHVDRDRIKEAELIGIGWDFQLIDQPFVINDWDVPLNQFISPNYSERFHR